MLPVDLPSTEQRARDPKFLADCPARALAWQRATEPAIAYAQVLPRRSIRTWTAWVDAGFFAGVVPRVGYVFVCTAPELDAHAILALVG